MFGIFKNHPTTRLEWQEIFSQYDTMTDFLIDLIAQEATREGINKHALLRYVEKKSMTPWEYTYEEFEYDTFNKFKEFNIYFKFCSNNEFVGYLADYEDWRDEVKEAIFKRKPHLKGYTNLARCQLVEFFTQEFNYRYKHIPKIASRLKKISWRVKYYPRAGL